MLGSLRRRTAAAVAVLLAAVAAPQVNAQEVLNQWNEEWLDTIRAVGGAPCPLARSQAILFVSMYDAVNSITRTHDPYLRFHRVTNPVNKEIAAAAAARRALTTLYPARTRIYNDLYNAQLANLPGGETRRNSVRLGEAAADAILRDRASDRTDSLPDYVYGRTAGAYRPTPPDFTSPPFSPGWGTTKPWALTSGNQFRPTGPLGYYRMDRLLKSSEYAVEFNEVKDYGRRNSTVRTADQTEIAWFWANDRNGTYKPPGHLMQVTQIVATDQGLNFDECARLYALAAIAMADAGLVAWDQKYSTSIDLWRPVTAIRQAHTDGNPATERDKNWLPLLEFSPPFPAYTSGHATFGASHAAVMAGFFGTDEITFTIGTDEPIVRNVTRTYHRFSDAGRENGVSRVYLGVHFRCDADSGFSSGTLLGRYVVENFLKERDCRGDMNADGTVNATDMRLFSNAYFAGMPMADMNSDTVVNPADYAIFVGYYLHGCK